jgi:hypothetical protein
MRYRPRIAGFFSDAYLRAAFSIASSAFRSDIKDFGRLRVFDTAGKRLSL